MKNNFLLCILSLLSLNCSAEQHKKVQNKSNSSAITCIPNRGRFGDQLDSYTTTKWLSYKFNIPGFYAPFEYSDQLILYEQEKMYTPECYDLFSNIVHLPLTLKDPLIPNNDTLYIAYWGIEAKVDWEDNVFMDDLKKMISPRYPIKKLVIPGGCKSIAVHIRNGGGFHFDTNEKREKWPLRFAPEEFFIEQVARLADMFPEEKLYVHIFTDHKSPESLKKKFEKTLNNPRITFGYRKNDNSHDSNVLEDFFSMMDFDCLIRPASQFSVFVQHLGNNKVVIHPTNSRKLPNGKRVIDAFNIKTRSAVGKKWNTKKMTVA